MECGWQWVWEDSMAAATKEEMALVPPVAWLFTVYEELRGCSYLQLART